MGPGPGGPPGRIPGGGDWGGPPFPAPAGIPWGAACEGPEPGVAGGLPVAAGSPAGRLPGSGTVNGSLQQGQRPRLPASSSLTLNDVWQCWQVTGIDMVLDPARSLAHRRTRFKYSVRTDDRRCAICPESGLPGQLVGACAIAKPARFCPPQPDRELPTMPI